MNNAMSDKMHVQIVESMANGTREMCENIRRGVAHWGRSMRNHVQAESDKQLITQDDYSASPVAINPWLYFVLRVTSQVQQPGSPCPRPLHLSRFVFPQRNFGMYCGCMHGTLWAADVDFAACAENRGAKEWYPQSHRRELFVAGATAQVWCRK